MLEEMYGTSKKPERRDLRTHEIARDKERARYVSTIVDYKHEGENSLTQKGRCRRKSSL